MVECARCGRTVDNLQILTPDMITRELTDSFGDSGGTLAGDDDMKLCVECMDEVKKN